MICMQGQSTAMTGPQTLTIEWGGGAVEGILEGGDGATAVLLAHGAGAGQRHPWMATMRSLLAARLPTMTFDYRYTAAGRRSPDRMDTLLAVHRAAADHLAARVDRVVLAGKSMGGRVASHLAGDQRWPAAGLVYFGYPLVPPATGAPRDTSHLGSIGAPQLFFAGSRDRLSPAELLAPIVATLGGGRLEVIADADHSFAVLKRSERTQAEMLETIAATTTEWVEGL
jgi:uncharacterized protein